MKTSKILACLILVSLSSGCATQLRLTYQSNPPGATLFDGSTCYGYCPITLLYNVTSADKQRGYLLIRSPLVQWPSGANASPGTMRADIRTIGYNGQYVFVRPTDVAGYETDAAFGLEFQRNQIFAAQAQAQQLQAASAFIGTMNQQNQNMINNMPKVRTTTGTIYGPGTPPVHYQQTQFGP